MSAVETTRAALQDVCIRMVVPMRREFGMVVEVGRMLRDRAYARRIVEVALHAGEERLRTYAALAARYLDQEAGGRAQAARSAGAADDAAAARSAARALIDAVGPSGERLAVRLEEARDAGEIAALIEQAGVLVANLRGTPAGTAYLARARSSGEGRDSATGEGLAADADVRLLGEHAAQCLSGLLGPYGEAHARGLREARDAASLRQRLHAARDAVESLLGAAVAADFMTAAAADSRL